MKLYALEQRTLPAVLADKAARHGDAPFLLGDEQLSYAALQDQVARFAGGLSRLGVRRGDPVLIMLPNSVGMVVSFMAVTWLGALEVPLNTSYRGQILSYVINDSRARVMIVHADYLAALDEVREHLVHLETLVVAGGPDRRAVPWDDVLASEAVPAFHCDPGDLMAIMYTSGTTGQSKDVMAYHHQAYQYANPVGTHMLVDGEVVYLTVPLFHIGGQWAATYGALLADGRVVVRQRFSVRNFWRDIDASGVTQTLLFGVMTDFIVKQPVRDDDGQHSLRRVTMAPVPRADWALAERFNLRINQGWGLTDAGCMTAPPCYDDPAADRDSIGGLRTDLYELRLVDENDLDVPDGTPGEAIVRERQPFVVMAGYWGQPEASATCIRDGWLHTGDSLLRRPDGSYAFVDRMSHRIRRRGENISSLAVEQEALAHEDVLECAVIGVPQRIFRGRSESRCSIASRCGLVRAGPHRLSAAPASRVHGAAFRRVPAGIAKDSDWEDPQGHPAQPADERCGVGPRGMKGRQPHGTGGAPSARRGSRHPDEPAGATQRDGRRDACRVGRGMDRVS